NKEIKESGVSMRSGFFSDTNVEKVFNYISNGQKPDKLHMVKGYFPETFRGHEKIKWRFVLLDADLYNPMKAGAECFWENIVDGGVLLIHDYTGGYSGTKKAIDEFFEPLGITP